MSDVVRFIHKPREDDEGKVSTIEVYGDGYVAFGNEDRDLSDEFSIQELKDIIDEAEYALENPIGDCWYDEVPDAAYDDENWERDYLD